MTERDSFRQPTHTSGPLHFENLSLSDVEMKYRESSYKQKAEKSGGLRIATMHQSAGSSSSAAASKAAKKAKATKKTERKETKIALKSKSTLKGSSTTGGKKSGKKKGNDSDTDDDDLEGILEKEEAHTVTEEFVEGPPSRRANATLTACPNGGHLWCIGGEFFSEDGRAYFYNDVFRYTSEKDEWRKFVSPTCLGPRSAHGVAVSLAGGGKIFLFGGEFSSLHQNTFHHYRDFCARSGHRLNGFLETLPCAIWRILRSWSDNSLSKRLVVIRHVNIAFSVERTTDHAVVSLFCLAPTASSYTELGGYCKEYAKGKRPVGVMLDHTWLLKITLPATADPSPASKPINVPPKTTSKAPNKQPQTQLTIKWERRKRASDAYAPSLHSGCTMTLWAGKGMGILFGGVTDEDTNEEALGGIFWNDLVVPSLKALRSQATAFVGVSKDTTRSPEDAQSTPLPGETLAMFYARSREYCTQKDYGNNHNQGKQLRRDGFPLSKERYTPYKPILAEVEKILEEAGLDEEEMRRGAAGGGLPLSAGGIVGFSRNRR
ncbi:hypothetical protein BYT27DRAFT_7249132 [Phlegmacium glaucopus]|nr:hypothetical protein BYT27DRAFT_7249132 [Phlegmacium glaucopus]